MNGQKGLHMGAWPQGRGCGLQGRGRGHKGMNLEGTACGGVAFWGGAWPRLRGRGHEGRAWAGSEAEAGGVASDEGGVA